ncbi:phosphinothricin acetyltransferase [Alteromonadaceae bacterium Bs31]|nr:phosphinothricin acetyltransferase [Alteromonadaceae bacterium Bs31]
MIRDVEKADYQTIVAIYNHYICNTVISFEEEEIDCGEISNRVDKVHSAGLSWLVVEQNHKVLGYAYASLWNERAAYRNTVEVSVYLHHQAVGKGYGRMLYEALFHRLRKTSVHVVISGIALPNPESVRLHEKFGMKKVAHYQEVGYKFGQWIDVGYWQLQLAG